MYGSLLGPGPIESLSSQFFRPAVCSPPEGGSSLQGVVAKHDSQPHTGTRRIAEILGLHPNIFAIALLIQRLQSTLMSAWEYTKISRTDILTMCLPTKALHLLQLGLHRFDLCSAGFQFLGQLLVLLLRGLH